MSGDEPAGVVFPSSADGRRSTSALGSAVVADALREADPAGALGAEQDANWRAGYLVHFRRLVEAGLASRDAAVSVARDGLESLHRRMRVVHAGGAETGLGTLLSAPAEGCVTTVTVPGTGQADDGLSLPYHGDRLRGGALLLQRQLLAQNVDLVGDIGRLRQEVGDRPADLPTACRGHDAVRARAVAANAYLQPALKAARALILSSKMEPRSLMVV